MQVAAACEEESQQFFSNEWQTAWHLVCVHSKYVCIPDMWATLHLQQWQRTVLLKNKTTTQDWSFVRMHQLTYVYIVLTYRPHLIVLIMTVPTLKHQIEVMWCSVQQNNPSNVRVLASLCSLFRIYTTLHENKRSKKRYTRPTYQHSNKVSN